MKGHGVKKMDSVQRLDRKIDEVESALRLTMKFEAELSKPGERAFDLVHSMVTELEDRLTELKSERDSKIRFH